VRLLDPMGLYVLRRPGPVDPAALEAIVEVLKLRTGTSVPSPAGPASPPLLS
jgi:hypothetical protein